MKNKQRGRPSESRNVRVVPEFREEPDIEKLGRALIAIAMRIAEMKNTEEWNLAKDGREGDAVA